MKKFLSLILIVSVLIVNINVYSYAMEIPDHDFEYDGFEHYWKIIQDVGFIVSYPAFSAGRSLGGMLKKYLNSVDEGSGDSITNDQDAGNWARNNITVNGDGNIVLNDNAKSFINYMIDDYKNDNVMYKGYSVDLQYYSNIWNFQNTVEEYQDDYYCFAAFGGNPISVGLLVCIPQGSYSFVYAGVNGTEKYKLNIYDTLTFDSPSMAGIKVFDLKSTGPVEINVSWSQISSKNFYCANRNYDYRANEYPIYYQSYQNDLNFVSYEKKFALDIFGSYSLFTSSGHGMAPYYINNSVYNDFSSSTGDFTITNDNSNHATYGDIEAYIGNTYNETGKYPTPEDININIEIISDNNKPVVPDPTPTPTPDNPSGGGSFVNNNNPVFNNNPNININLLPGDGTVSGNGTGGSSGIGNIFGFLSDIGKFLGDLIKNLGQALVDVIKGIGDLLNSIITELPTVFFDFLGAVFNWLPEEWVRLMGLSFACMLIVGVIKIFRR